MEYYEELQCFVRRQNKNAKYSGTIFKRGFLEIKFWQDLTISKDSTAFTRQ